MKEKVMSKDENKTVEILDKEETQIQNPFAEKREMQFASPVQTDGQLAVAATREIAEVQVMVFVAKQFPRNKIEACDKIKNDCTRPTLAKGALYSYARGGTEITGPSIRLAESIAQNWGNIDFGIKELEQKNGVSKVMAFAWDMETNSRQTKIFEIPHIRTKNEYINGKKTLVKVPLEDPRDIYELVANNGSRRLRACILGIIPGDVVEMAVKQCNQTLNADPENSNPEKIKKLVEAFEKLGVDKVAIEKKIQCRIDAIKPAQVVNLRTVYSSIKDGFGNPSDYFEIVAEQPTESGVNGLKSKLAEGK